MHAKSHLVPCSEISPTFTSPRQQVSFPLLVIFCAALIFLQAMQQEVSAADSILNADIVEMSGNVPLTGDDEFSLATPIGFTFTFFGTDYTEFYVNTNGILFFASPSSAYNNTNTLPASSIAAMWDDLMSYHGSKPERDDYVFYKTEGTAPNRQLIVQWNNYGIYNSEQQFGTMQIILYEGSNNIQLHYISLLTAGRSDGGSGSVGIHGTSQMLHSFNQAVITQGSSVCFDASGTPYTKSVITTPNSAFPFDGSPLTSQASPPPDKPQNLEKGGAPDIFQWNSSAHADSYRLVISTNSNLNSPLYDQSGITTTSKDTNLSFSTGTTYFWAVQAHNDYGDTFSDTRHFNFSPPVATADTYSVAKAGVLHVVTSAGILKNDSHADTAVKVTDPLYAESFTFRPDGSFSYDPDESYEVGNDYSDHFTYHAVNQDGNSSDVTVTINVTHTEHAPTATEDAYTTPEDTPLILAAPGVLLNDHDIDVHDILTATGVSDPSNGTLKLNVDGGLTYIPDTDFNGTDSFTYKANDGNQDSNTVTVTITVNAVNDAPDALADSYSIAEDTPLAVPASQGILRNDNDAEGDQITASLATDSSHGLLNLKADGSFTYIPDSDFNGTDSFTYTAGDGSADSSSVTVTIHIHEINDPPIASADSYKAHEDTGLIVKKGVLNNDTDVDHNPLTVRLVSDVANGSLHMNPDGTFNYTPDLNFTGSDSFSYVAFDGAAESNQVDVLLLVDAVNDAPEGISDSYSAMQGTTLKIDAAKGVLANDHDVDGDSLLALLVTGSQHGGTVQWVPDGSFTYIPDPLYYGNDTLTYKVTDGNLESSDVTVNITVKHVNHAPLAATDAYSLMEDGKLSVNSQNGLLANDLDIDGDTLLVTAIPDAPGHGTLQMMLDGSFIYRPEALFSGTDSFTYIASDGHMQSAAISVTLTVNHTNHTPLASDDSYSVPKNSSTTITAANGLLRNDLDIDGDQLRVVLVTLPTYGALALTPDGSFSYLPQTDYIGSDSYTYYVTDGAASSNTATVTIDIHDINAPPLTGYDEYDIAPNTVLLVHDPVRGVLNNDIDTDGNHLDALLSSEPTKGVIHLEKDGTFTYIPDEGASGLDSFYYNAWDGFEIGASPQQVVINIEPIYYTLDVIISKNSFAKATVTSQPTGIDCGSDCSESYLNGTHVELTVASDNHSKFLGWSGACSGTGSCIINMYSNQTVTAEFHKFPWHLFTGAFSHGGDTAE